eukprot:5845487-Pyramimonas_sp.AAC.1
MPEFWARRFADTCNLGSAGMLLGRSPSRTLLGTLLGRLWRLLDCIGSLSGRSREPHGSSRGVLGV